MDVLPESLNVNAQPMRQIQLASPRQGRVVWQVLDALLPDGTSQGCCTMGTHRLGLGFRVCTMAIGCTAGQSYATNGSPPAQTFADLLSQSQAI